ncbi:MAG: hypothetical protein AAGD38_05065 [Acidobacteriota bacterium]
MNHSTTSLSPTRLLVVLAVCVAASLLFSTPSLAQSTPDPYCNPTASGCNGNYSDLIDHILLRETGEVSLILTAELATLIDQGSTCTLAVGDSLNFTPNGSGGKENWLQTLYISFAADAHLTLVIEATSPTDNTCQIKFLRVLSGQH